jgi:hypothetical protein
MAGPVLFGVLIVIALLLVAVGVISPLLAAVLAVIGGGLLAVMAVLSKVRGSAIVQPDPRPSGVPTTREAAYEPVEDPAERRTS